MLFNIEDTKAINNSKFKVLRNERSTMYARYLKANGKIFKQPK